MLAALNTLTEADILKARRAQCHAESHRIGICPETHFAWCFTCDLEVADAIT